MEKEIEDEDLCQILSGKEDSMITIFKIIRAVCKYTNEIFNTSKVASTILGLGNKEDSEEDHQIIQTHLNDHQKKSNKIKSTPYPSRKDVNQESTSGLYSRLSNIETSRCTIKITDKDSSATEKPPKYTEKDYLKLSIDKHPNKYV